MFFWCLPPSGKCEWANLRHFVKKFNVEYKATYRLAKCLDVLDSSQPQPEVFLDGNGDRPMVIERKALVWPHDYFKYHRTEHDFAEKIHELLNAHFTEGAYALEVNASSLRGNKTQINSFCESIADLIIKNKIKAITVGMRSNSPIPWTFRPLSEIEYDDDTPQSGIGVFVIGNLLYNDDISKFRAIKQKAITDISKKISELLIAAEKKFNKYTNCLKIVVLEFYGTQAEILNDEDVVRIITEVHIPSAIDQIWIAKPEWISEYDWQISYDRVR